MKMGKKIKKPRKSPGKINPRVSELKNQSHDVIRGKVAFSSVCEKYCLLSTWASNELKDLLSCFKILESKTWNEIKRDSGLNYKPVNNMAIPLPSNFPPDGRLMSLKVSEKKRLYGYRIEDFYYIVWFDKNHEVCPMGKPKRYSV